MNGLFMEYCLSMFKQHSSVVKHGLPIPELAMKVSFAGNDCWTKFGNLPARHVWLPEGTEDFFPMMTSWDFFTIDSTYGYL